MRILLVEDNQAAAAALAKGLREQGYAVDVAFDGEEASYKASVSDYDIVILDLMLPRVSGLEVCGRIRASGSQVPILMLTARDSLNDRVSGLDRGADDYLVKPFQYRELLARIRALLRRGPTPHFDKINVADLVVDLQTRRVSRAGRVIDLTAKEYSLLEYLVRRSGQLVTRTAISEHVWDETYDPCSNCIEVYIQRLRRKIDEGRPTSLLRTRRGEGYILTSELEANYD